MTNSNLVDKIKSTVETTFDMQFDDVYSFEDLSTSVKTINHEAPDNAGNIDIEFPKQVQADLTQNDESALDHVKGRTHWSVETTLIEVLPRVNLYRSNDPGTTIEPFTVNREINLEVGKTYKVLLNNSYFKCVATYVELDDGNLGIALGDLSKFGNETYKGYPFTLVVLPDSLSETLGYTATIDSIHQSGGWSLAVYENNETIHKLDNKYLDMNWIPTINREVFLSSCSSVGDFGIPFLNSSMVQEGDNLIVYWDGVRYECTVNIRPEDYPMGVGGTFLIGNMARPDYECENTGEPFLFEVSEITTYSNFGDLKFHDVVIYKVESNKLPDNYIPDDVVRVVDDGKALVIKSSTVDSTKIFKITVDDSGTLSATPV